MLEQLVVLAGKYVGAILSHISKEEMDRITKTLKILTFVMMVVIIAASLTYSFNVIWFVIGMIIGTFLLLEYFFLGIISVSMIITGADSMLMSSIMFVFGIPFGSLQFHQKNYIMFFINTALFFLPYLLIFLGWDLMSLGAGGIAGIMIRRLKKRDYF